MHLLVMKLIPNMDTLTLTDLLVTNASKRKHYIKKILYNILLPSSRIAWFKKCPKTDFNLTFFFFFLKITSVELELFLCALYEFLVERKNFLSHKYNSVKFWIILNDKYLTENEITNMTNSHGFNLSTFTSTIREINIWCEILCYITIL